MNTITEQLAEALRSLRAQHASFNADKYDAPEWSDDDDEAQDNASRALAAYDAMRTAPATGEHTAEPWINDGTVVSAKVDPENSDDYIAPVCYMDEDWTTEIQQANARRIVACVNYCAGLSTEYLENAR